MTRVPAPSGRGGLSRNGGSHNDGSRNGVSRNGLWRYGLCGAAATAVHWIVLIGLVEGTGLRPWWAAAIGAGVGAIVSYTLNRAWTFAGSTAPHRQALPRFLLVAASGAAGNAALVWLGSSVLGAGYLWSQAAATVSILLAGYWLNARWSFAAGRRDQAPRPATRGR